MTDNKGGMSGAAIAGVAGAVVGAGVAVAATKVMSDPKLSKKVTDTLGHVKDQVFEAIESVKSQGQEASQQVQGKVDDAKQGIKEATDKK